MPSFSQLIGRLKAEQQLGRNLDRANLGMDVTDERLQLEEARAEYRKDIEEAQRQMQKNANKRGKRGLMGNIIGTAIGYALGGPAGGKLLGSALGGGVGSYLGRESVDPYRTTFSTDLLPGKFLKGARRDLSMDLTASTNFVSDAADQMRMSNFTNALGDAINTASLINSFGTGVPTTETKTPTDGTEAKTQTNNNETVEFKRPVSDETMPIEESLLDMSNILGGSQPSTYDYQVGGQDGFTLKAPFVDPFDLITDDEGKVNLFGGVFDAEYMNRILGNDRRNF
jgi:hypothetical protein